MNNTLLFKTYAMRIVLIYLGLIGSLLGLPVSGQAQGLSLDAALTEAVSQRPDLQVFALQIAQKEAAIRKLQVDYLPQVRGDAQVRYNFINPVSVLPANIFNPDLPEDELVAVQFGTNWAYSAGLTLTQPLFDPSIGYRIQREALSQQQLGLQAQDAESRILAAVTEAYYGVLLGEGEIEQARADSLRAATVYRDLVAAEAEGRALPADVAQARLGVRQASLQLARAQHNLQTLRELLLTRMGRPLEGASTLDLTTSLEELLTSLEAGQSPLMTGADRIEWEQLRLQQRELELDRQIQRRSRWPQLSLTGYLGANHFSNQFEPFRADQWSGSS
ncbi:MAG: TolC family protein, partial [Bacteroidetes bacterium]